MKLLLCFDLCLLFLFYETSESTKVECNFNTGPFSQSLMNSAYYCTVPNAKIISRQEAVADEISGSHKSGYNNDNIVAFQISGEISFFFLKNLENYFKNLKAIAYQSCQLKEIHQHNLKPFPKLLDLFLNGNHIQVLEEGLFDFNLDLVYVQISNNKIIQINSKIFDNLKKVTHIYLGSNTCITKDASSPAKIKELIQDISSKCQNTEFLNLESKLNTLKNSSKSLVSESFKQQLENLQGEIKNSKFSNFSSFEDQLEILKNTTFDYSSKLCNFGNESEKIQQESTTEQTTTLSPCVCQQLNPTSLEKSSKIDKLTEILEKIRASQEEHKSSQLDSDSTIDDKVKVMGESLADFQNKIDALSSKVSSIADIVEQLEDKLGKIFKSLNIKVTIDV